MGIPYVQLLDLLKSKNVSIRRLRKILFGASTEKTAAVVGDGAKGEAPPSNEAAANDLPGEGVWEVAAGQSAARVRAKGHGRNGADAYSGAEKIEVPHETLKPGDPCPECIQGTVYETTRPAPTPNGSSRPTRN